MFHDYRLKADGCIQNDGEPQSHSALIELSGNSQPGGASPDAERFIGMPAGRR